MSGIVIFKTAEDLALNAAQQIVQAAQEAVRARGRFLVALAGGSTPAKTYARLTEPERARQIAWNQAFLFFGDERFVPPDDPNSNFGMARRTLIDHVTVPGDQVFPVPTDRATPAESAADYAETLADVFALPVNTTPPRFDLILLGLGEDGHTASLFPGMPTLAIEEAWVAPSPPGTLPPPVDRSTLTFPVLNAARRVLFLVSGVSKAEALRDVIEGAATRETRPAAGVRPRDGMLTWLVDEAAASLLTSPQPLP